MKNKKISIILSLVLCLFASFMGVFFSACSCENVGAGKIKEIYIKEGSIQTQVAHNSTYSTEGIEIFAKLTNGKEREIDVSECEISTIDTTTVGEKELVVSYEAYEVKVTINVYKTLSSISLTGVQNNVLHNSNSGQLDLSGAQIVLKFSDNSTENINVYSNGNLTAGVVVENNSTSAVGNYTLKVKYLNKECTFDYVVEKYLTNFEANLAEQYRSVAFNGEFNSSKITAVGTYSDGSTENFSNDKLIISSLDTTNKENIKDDNVVVVKLKANETYSDEINVKIYAKLESISYHSGLASRIKYNTDLDTTNVKIVARYNDESTKEISQNIIVEGFNKTPSKLGNQTLTIKYKDETINDYKTTTTQIEVYEELESLKVEQVNVSDATTGYVLQNSDWQTEKTNVCSKFKIVAVYTKNEVVLNGTEEYNNVSFSNIDTTTLGEKDLIVGYNGKTKEIKINVIENWTAISALEILSISIVNTSIASEVDYNSTLDLSNLSIEITYTNGLNQVLKASENTSGENKIDITKQINTSVHGEQTLEVSYKSQYATKTINVKAYLVSISIKSGTEVETLTYGENLDLSNVKIMATFTNGEEVEVDASCDDENFSNTNLNEKQIVSYSYSMQKVDGTTITKSVSMEVQIVDEIERLTNLVVPVRRSEVGEEYDYSQITASVQYLSGKTEDVSASLSFSGLNVNAVGTQKLKISYTKNSKEVFEQIDIEIYDSLVSVNIKSGTVSENVNIGAELITDNIVLILTYKSGKTEEASSGYTVGTFSTEKEGEFPLTVSYQTKQATKTINVLRTYVIMGYSDPTFVTTYKTNSQNKNTFTKTGSTGNVGFTDLGNEYVVGSENDFVYNPIILDENTTSKITEFRAKIAVYLQNEETNEYQMLTDNISDYVAVDDTLHTFKFTTLAESKHFKIEVLPYKVNTSEQDKVSASIFTFKVIKAYNVYNAHDFSMLDNVNASSKWSEKKTDKELEISNNIHGIVLHSNISIQDSDLPSVHFFTKDEVNSTDSDYDKVVGSLKDSLNEDLELIYHRKINEGETFTIEGNYFKLSAQDLSLIARGMVDGVWPVRNEGDAITVHTTLMGLSSKDRKAAGYELNNIALFGNSKKSETADMSGGVISLKTRAGVSVKAYNNVSQGWYISYMFEGNSTTGDNCKNQLIKVNCFDANNTLVYNWAARDMEIVDSILIGAGGPVMICDHVDNNETTGEGGYITNVKVTNSVLESYVAGTEGWFATYEGSGAIVGSMKAMNALITPYGNTLLDSKGEKINAIAVYKSGSAEGLTTSTIRGTFADTDEKYTNGLDFSNSSISATKQSIIASLAAQGMTQTQIESTLAQMAVLQTFNGAVGVPGNSGWLVEPDQTTFANSENYMGVYLFNGMGIVMGLNKAA